MFILKSLGILEQNLYFHAHEKWKGNKSLYFAWQALNM